MPTTQLQELGEWKVDQPVILYYNSGFTERKAITKIKKITSGRGGTIFVDDMMFDRNGWSRSQGYHRPYIKAATPELIEETRGENARNKLAHFKWKEITLADANKYINILREAGLEI